MNPVLWFEVHKVAPSHHILTTYWKALDHSQRQQTVLLVLTVSRFFRRFELWCQKLV